MKPIIVVIAPFLVITPVLSQSLTFTVTPDSQTTISSPTIDTSGNLHFVVTQKPAVPAGITDITVGDGNTLSFGPDTWSFGTVLGRPPNGKDHNILRNGVNAANGYGIELKIVSGILYTWAADVPAWYLWTGSGWRFVGKAIP